MTFNISPSACLFDGRYKALSYVKSLLPPFPVTAELGLGDGFFSKKIMEGLGGWHWAVDIGVAWGCSVISDGQGERAVKNWQNGNYEEFVQGEFKEEIASGRFKFSVGCSWASLEEFEDNFFDFIYVDAGHCAGAVAKDCGVSLRKIKNGGILMFNDWTCYSPSEKREYGVLYSVNNSVLSCSSVVCLALDFNGHHDIAFRVHK